MVMEAWVEVKTGGCKAHGARYTEQKSRGKSERKKYLEG
jgi:hypothetical protein